MKKLSISFILVISILLISSQIVFAHPDKQADIINWGEDIGWAIREDKHNGSTDFYYKCDKTAKDYLSTIEAGAALWSNYGTISNNSSATGTIFAQNEPGNGVKAYFSPTSMDSLGHLTKWKIVLNSSKEITPVNIAHEFGHVYGLVDLTADSNNDKLMYGYASGSATEPAGSDVRGFNVITGVHTDHNWIYKPTSKAKHKKYCFECEGYKTESCTFVNKKCKYCGRKQ